MSPPGDKLAARGRAESFRRGGLSAPEALAGATAVAADHFGLDDRGRIRPGLRADLLLVDGDPTERIQDSLSIAAVWRRGERLERTIATE